MSEIDLVRFGQFLAKVDGLTEKLTEAEKSIDALTARLSQVEERYRLGKGVIAGALVGAGFAVYGFKDAFTRIVDWFLK